MPWESNPPDPNKARLLLNLQILLTEVFFVNR
nr:MAG TPA: hypothetical protein [Caudoviricetes sp.]DAT90741.1 MAG TPA: hypothetical protein [Bacteriophage sp.]